MTRDLSAYNSITVLGGSGFIGTRLVSELIKVGLSAKIGDLKTSETFPERWEACDVRNKDTLRQLICGSTALINLAAEHRDDIRPLSRYYETNVEGAAQVCNAAREQGISKIVFTSSVAVYGFHPLPVDEEGPFAPFNAYGQTKLEAEGIYRAWATEDPSRTLVIVRPTVVFGERNRGNVYNLLRQIATGKFLMIGSGTNIKSMAYVDNVVAFLIHTLSLPPGVHIFNYVDGPDLDTNTLVNHIRHCLGRPRSKLMRIPKVLALAAGYTLDGIARLTQNTFPISAIRVRKFCESTQFKADRTIQSGFSPPYSLKEGLARTIQFEFSPK